MFEIKVGKLMVRETMRLHKGRGARYEFVDIKSYSNSELSTIGRKLIEHTTQFISFMDLVDINIGNVSENIRDYSKYNESALKKVYELVDDITIKSKKYYIDSEHSQYRRFSDYNKVELGKKCWKYLIQCGVYQNIKNSIKDYDDDFFTTLADSINFYKTAIVEIEDYFAGNESTISIGTFNDLSKSADKAILKHVKTFTFDKDKGEWVKKVELSDKELGEIAWDFIYKNTDEYKTIDSKDIEYIEERPELIWKNVNESKKDSVKDYLLNPDIEDYCKHSNAWDEIQLAVDNIVTDEMGYYYLDCGRWDKLSNLGKMIWNIAMKHDSVFANVSKLIEDNKSFDFYMECIARNIESNSEENTGKFQTYNQLMKCMREKSIKDSSEWTHNDWLNKFSGNEKVYGVMMSATDKMIGENLADVIVWNEDELMWEPK